jgi:RHS repeat-associated protein
VLSYYASYYPFGQLQPGRYGPANGTSSGVASAYRFGYNGKEKDNNGELGLTTHDYGFRIYNPGLGRFLSTDPLSASYPWNSTYAFAEHDVISSIDLEGLEKYRIVSRCFAPRGSFKYSQFETKADDRIKFGIADYRKLSARVHTLGELDLGARGFKAEVSSQPSHAFGVSWRAPTMSIEVSVDKEDIDKRQKSVTTTFHSKNGMEVGPAIDHQYKVDIAWYPSVTNELVISKTTTGDVFPARETEIFDSKGTGLFIGVSTAVGGPLTNVWSSATENLLSTETLRVQTDAEGNFLGVHSFDTSGNAVILSPDAYNKKFTDMPVWNQQAGRPDYEKQ